VSVIATSNYFSYLIGRKQVTYEELRRQVDRVVQLIEEKRGEEDLAPTTGKQRQERLEQNTSGLTDLTTSTVNGRTTVVAPEPASAGRPAAAALNEDTAVAPPDHEVRVQPPESSPSAGTKQRDSIVHQRGSRRQKVSPAAGVPRRGAAASAMAEQPAQSTTSPSAKPDVGLAGQ
jgi:hypothetical protein